MCLLLLQHKLLQWVIFFLFVVRVQKYKQSKIFFSILNNNIESKETKNSKDRLKCWIILNKNKFTDSIALAKFNVMFKKIIN